MLVFSVNGKAENDEYFDTKLFFTKMVKELTEKYPNIASIYFLENM